MSRADRALVLVGAACVVGLVVSLFVRELPDAWAGLASTIIGTVLGGAILAGLLTVAWRWWREAQEPRPVADDAGDGEPLAADAHDPPGRPDVQVGDLVLGAAVGFATHRTLPVVAHTQNPPGHHQRSFSARSRPS